MSDLLANAMNFPSAEGGADEDRIDSRANDTTPGDQEPVPWEVIAVNLAPIEAEIIKGRLESLDIPAQIQQESIGSVMGLTVGPLGAASILVPESLAETARAILAETFDPQADDEETAE